MKRLRSAWFLAWSQFTTFISLPIVFASILGCIGCGSKPPVFHITARDEHADNTDQYKILRQGQELGTITGSGTLEFDLQGQPGENIDQMMPQGIEARVPGECGWVKTSFTLNPSVGFDEIKHYQNAGHVIPATMDLLGGGAAAFDWVTIFVDNRGGPPQTVSIGGLQQLVPAGATKRLMFAHTGGCDAANDVRLNGAVVGPVDIHRTLLIDITHSHCYREDSLGYGVPSSHGKNVFRAGAFKYLNDNPDFFMESVPTYQPNATMMSVVYDAPCPRR